MRISTASLAFAALLAAPVITIAPSDAAGGDESPAQAEVMFQARKTWFKDNFQRRLDLLESHQNCIDAASSMQEFKTCRKDNKKARKSLKQDYRTYMNKVRNQLGLPARAENPLPTAAGSRPEPLIDQAASRAATPGSTLPSSSSRLAPPPVEM